MPSPAAHSLIGLSLALAALRVPAKWRVSRHEDGRPAASLRRVARALWEQRVYLLMILLMANLPDVDYIPGVLTGRINAFHYEYTHTAGWVVGMAVAVWLGWRSKDRKVGVRELALLLAAGASHLLADWVTDDQAAPYGIMAFWPLTSRRYMCSVHVFGSLWKADWADVVKLHNLKVVALEVAVCLPLLGLAALAQTRAARLRGGLSEPGLSGRMAVDRHDA